MKNAIIMLVLFLVSLVQILSGQQSTPGVLEGFVVKSKTNDALGKVRVELLNPSGAPLDIATTTDDSGKFILPSVRPGQYRLLASRQAYIRAEYGQRTVEGPGVIVTVAAGQRLNVRIEMVPGGVISGRVLDRGKPVGVTEAPLVFAMKASYELGQRVLTNVLSSRVNDLGEYHIFWLPPGRYYVVSNINDAPGNQGVTAPTLTSVGFSAPFAGISGGPRFVLSKAVGNQAIDTEMHVPMFYPGTPDFRNATVIDVGAGEEVRGIDIHADPVPALHVRGVVTGAQGVSVPVSLQPLNPSIPTPLTLFGPAAVSNANSEANGSFDKEAVAPGAYILFSQSGKLAARVPIEVRDRDVNGVNVPLSPGVSVSGSVVFEGSAGNRQTPGMGALRVVMMREPIVGGFRERFNPVAAFTLPAVPQADGLFTLPAPNAQVPLLPGDYRVFVLPFVVPPAGWADPPATIPGINLLQGASPQLPPALENNYVKSIRLGDRDVLRDGLTLEDQPRDRLTIVIGTNAVTMEGRVLGPDKKPFGAATVVLIPEDGLRFRINHKYTSTDDVGHFQIKGIPPGDYKLFAWEQAERGSWQDPEFVAKYESQGKTVHVDEGSKLSIEVSSIAP